MIEYPKIAEWRTWQQAQGLSDRTIDARIWRVEDLAEFIGSDPADAISEQIVKFMAMVSSRAGYRTNTVSRSTLATYHSHLKAWFAWLVKVEYRDDDPCMRVPVPKTPKRYPRPVTDRELHAIFSVPVYRRTRMMLLLAAFQGLRVSEIAKVRGEDVNLLDLQLRVIGKGGVDAQLPLSELVADEAKDYPRKGYWFPQHKANQDSDASGPILGRSVSDIIGAVFDRAGVDGGAHRLRHWYATALLGDGASTLMVKGLMRHASVQSTELYAAVDAAGAAAAIARLKMPGSAVA